ncbi:alpha/beta fold hydrolase [Variovorax sp. J31P207]|uniref:PHA/PHB synthase family protein n=1 Tax=Variovorax sp. J31P207 TaxID=3053510 RepID=UPI002577689D|nr:alpha/beta fold hydrolase [Variovorax sp. J31P207]MDM0065271.1 alpha/beta fold hydrolase [Variovorax sp. J31P207]
MTPETLQRLFDNWTRTWLPPHASDDAPTSALADDPRFKDPAWASTAYGQFLMKWYEAAGQTAQRVGDLGTSLPPHQKNVWNFYVQYAVDALSPSNYFLTNPQALQKAADTRGQSVLTGVTRMLDDLQKNALPASNDMQAFTVGVNLATTAGSVVFQNEIFQLIQYQPLAPKVAAVPILIVPPCVNKFYAFDLNEQKSFVKYLLEQGHNVFMMSWRNPHPGETSHGWEDYVFDGVHKAVEMTCEIAGSPSTNLLSWCIGGALSVSALAVMNAAEKKRIASATFLTTLVDYSDHGDVGIFVDEPQVAAFEPKVRMKGVMPGRDLAKAMAMLHAKDSIWHFYVNNYLLGDNIPPFDVLYWNSDTANVPGELYQFYVENMYLKNLLREPNALRLRGRKSNVGNIDAPCCFVSATEDHIVPWRTTLLALDLVSGPAEFLLTEGGHVSGTAINHPAKSRKSYWFNGPKTTDADKWKEGAEKHQGSWWPEWCRWVAKTSGKQVAAPKQLGSRECPPLEAAPGSYVLEQVPQG